METAFILGGCVGVWIGNIFTGKLAHNMNWMGSVVFGAFCAVIFLALMCIVNAFGWA